MTPALSVTNRVGAGGTAGPAANATPGRKRETKRRTSLKVRGAAQRFPATNDRWPPPLFTLGKSEFFSSSELHSRRFVGALDRLEVRTILEAGEVRDDDRRERTAQCVIRLRDVVESAALDRNAVLGALELGLEVAEV